MKDDTNVFTQPEYSKEIQPEIDKPVSLPTTDPINDESWKIQDKTYSHKFGWPV